MKITIELGKQAGYSMIVTEQGNYSPDIVREVRFCSTRPEVLTRVRELLVEYGKEGGKE